MKVIVFEIKERTYYLNDDERLSKRNVSAEARILHSASINSFSNYPKQMYGPDRFGLSL